MSIITGSQKGLTSNRKKTSIHELPRPPRKSAKSRDDRQQFSGQQILKIDEQTIEFIGKRRPAVVVYINNIKKPECSGSLSGINTTDKKIVVQLSGYKQPKIEIAVTKSIMIELVLPNKEVEK